MHPHINRCFSWLSWVTCCAVCISHPSYNHHQHLFASMCLLRDLCGFQRLEPGTPLQRFCVRWGVGRDRWLERMTRHLFSSSWAWVILRGRDGEAPKTNSLQETEILDRWVFLVGDGPGVTCTTELGRGLCFLAQQGIKHCFSWSRTSSFTSIRRQLTWHGTKAFSHRSCCSGGA